MAIPSVVGFLERLSRAIHLQGTEHHRDLLLEMATYIPGGQERDPLREGLASHEPTTVTQTLAALRADEALHEHLAGIAGRNASSPLTATPPPLARSPSPSYGVYRPAPWRPAIPDEAIVRAATRLAGVGEDQEPFRAAIELAFPAGTPEGDFLRTNLLDAGWRTAEDPTGFPKTPEAFLDFLRIMVGNTAVPLGIWVDRRGTDELERVGRQTPAPVSAASANVQRTILPTPARRLTPEGLEHFELAIHLLLHLERLAGQELVGGEPGLRERIFHFAEVLNAIDSPLFLGSPHRVVRRIVSLLEEAVAGTGTRVVVTAYPVYGLRRQARYLQHDGFEELLRQRCTSAELHGLRPFLERPTGAWELCKVFARLLATKRAVLKSLRLPPDPHWSEAEAVDDLPNLSGEAQEALAGRSLITASTVGKGDLGIGVALLEPTRGASGIGRIRLDVVGAPPDFRESPITGGQRPLKEAPRALRFGEALVKIAVESGS